MLPEIEIIKRNRSQAYLRTKQYDAALSDTNYPNFGAQPSEKALFRAAEALYYFTRFNESYQVLEALCRLAPGNEEALTALDRARDRSAESTHGCFDFKFLLSATKTQLPPHLDNTTYVGSVEVRASEGKGRGLHTTKTVKVGRLLLCEKAFGHAFVDNISDSNASLTCLMDIETSAGIVGVQADLIGLLVRKSTTTLRLPQPSLGFTKVHMNRPTRDLQMENQ
jgi:hypothetical protein